MSSYPAYRNAASQRNIIFILISVVNVVHLQMIQQQAEIRASVSSEFHAVAKKMWTQVKLITVKYVLHSVGYAILGHLTIPHVSRRILVVNQSHYSCPCPRWGRRKTWVPSVQYNIREPEDSTSSTTVHPRLLLSIRKKPMKETVR